MDVVRNFLTRYEQKREEERASRPERRNLRGGLEGGEQSTGLGDLKLGR